MQMAAQATTARPSCPQELERRSCGTARCRYCTTLHRSRHDHSPSPAEVPIELLSTNCRWSGILPEAKRAVLCSPAVSVAAKGADDNPRQTYGSRIFPVLRRLSSGRGSQVGRGGWPPLSGILGIRAILVPHSHGAACAGDCGEPSCIWNGDWVRQIRHHGQITDGELRWSMKRRCR